MTAPGGGLLVGADVGGTATRVAVADRFGTVLAVAHEAAGNPNAVGLDTCGARIAAAMAAALRQAQDTPGQAAAAQRRTLPVAVVLGMAGYGTARAAGPQWLDSWLPAEVTVRPRIVSDLGVAYASATDLPHGYVVIGGTGSGAAEIEAGEIVTRRGAWGWLLGDEGGGFWLGREAVRHALAQAERDGPLDGLSRGVVAALQDGSDAAPMDLLLRRPYQLEPVRLADLAPVVTGLVDSDPAAAAITARAADQLSRLVLGLSPRPGRPVVTAGSVLQADGPLRSAFVRRVSEATGSPVLGATNGLVGALWLAAGAATDATPVDPAVHRRLRETVTGAAR